MPNVSTDAQAAQLRPSDTPVAAEHTGPHPRSPMSFSCSMELRALYDRLSEELHAVLDGGIREMHARRVGRLLELSSARGILHAALADVLEAWNTAHSDALLRLPKELATAIFRLLEFRDRIAVSHVSRGWRDTALSDPFLWNVARLAAPRPVYSPRPGSASSESSQSWSTPPRRPQPPPADILREMLVRSDPVPFSLTWEDELFPEGLLGLLFSNVHRLYVLEMELSEDGLRQLFALPAPQLRSFVCDSDTCELPARWDAPGLQKLELRTVRVPAHGEVVQLNSVDEFRCYTLEGLEQRGTSLFAIFPALTSLYIACVTAEVMPYLSEPPATLTELTLDTNDSDLPIDYAPFLAACRRCKLRLLNLASVQDLAPVLERFTAAVAGTSSMNFNHTFQIELKEDGGGVAYEISLATELSFPRQPHLTSYLERTSSLALDVDAFLPVLETETWDHVLPALRQLMLGCRRTPDWPSGALQPIRAPLLEHIAFRLNHAGDAPQWITERFPAVLRSSFVYSRPLLACISVESEWRLRIARSLEEENLSKLRALAERVRINLWGRPTNEYAHEPLRSHI
ncbi:hypothetical protein AURDEDRAFT_185830 [Auricularia subglabra TFB-10046 SS5]|nr:hypothetical protein AURDEDRAFT_185830 [Auricularia subglabra TFB-10046 SS5]